MGRIDYINAGQKEKIAELCREIDLDNPGLKRLWDVAGTPKTSAAGERMIILLTVKALFKRIDYDRAQISETVTSVIGEYSDLERLPRKDLEKIKRVVLPLTTAYDDPLHAAFMVASFKIDSTVIYQDQLKALTACDHYAGGDTLKVLFESGRAVRLSIGGKIFEQVKWED